MKIYEPGLVVKEGRLAGGIYELFIETEAAKSALPGQFVMLYPQHESTLLPRPISICEVLAGRVLRLVYRAVGKGTKEFSLYRQGENLRVLGPLGNGFPISEGKGKKALLIGGGIGLPPLLELSKELKAKECIALLGYRNDDFFLNKDFERYSKVYIATEDGSAGTKGNVIDAARANNITADVIYACGPMPMLRAIKQFAEELGIPAYISLEERMACGVGACLGCVCKTVKKDDHSKVNNARVCTEGPVFLASEVEI
jgi:dihydroorotate dehydrogenase electron transfer subunit